MVVPGPALWRGFLLSTSMVSLTVKHPRGQLRCPFVTLTFDRLPPQDTVLTMQGLTEYKRIVPHTVLNQEINVRYSRKGLLAQVELTKTRPVARPLEVRQHQVHVSETGVRRKPPHKNDRTTKLARETDTVSKHETFLRLWSSGDKR